MIGNYQNKLDDKGRITIPSKFRKTLGNKIVISFGFDNTLEIRTSASFKEWSSLLVSKGNLSKSARQLSRIILGNSFEIDIDSSGRALLPKQLIDFVNIKKDVTLVGVGDKIEIHSFEEWEKSISDSKHITTSLEQLAEELNKSQD